MKNKIEKFVCKSCDGDGWITSWEGNNKKTGRENLELQDCACCKGKGFVFIEVIDKRKESKHQKAKYLKEY